MFVLWAGFTCLKMIFILWWYSEFIERRVGLDTFIALLVSYLKRFHRIYHEMSNTQNFTHVFINSISFGLIQPLSGGMM